MTTGSEITDNRVYGQPAGGWIGRYHSREWFGVDRPPLPPRAPPGYYTVTVDGKKWKFRKLRQGDRPPKRAFEAPHGFYKRVLTLRDNLVTYNAGDDYTRCGMLTFANPGWGALNLLDANDQIKLINKLAEAIRGSDFNAAVALSEGNQALRMIAENAYRVNDMVFALRHRDPKSALRALAGARIAPKIVQDPLSGADLARRVLELQYGWKPLFSDVHAGAEWLAHQLSVPLQKTYRASVRGERKSVHATDYSSCPAASYHTRGIIATFSEAPNEGVIPKLGLQDPEIILWEKMPFSFVGDWFIPIGQYLNARAFTSRVGGPFVTSDKRVGFCGPVLVNSQYAGPYFEVIFERSVSQTLTVPPPVFKGLGQAASWQHCVNAVALLVGLKGTTLSNAWKNRGIYTD